MKPQEKRLAAIIAGAVFAGAVLGAGGLYLFSAFHSGRGSAGSAGSLNGTVDITPVSTTSSVIVGTLSTSTITSSTSLATGGNAPVDMSDWKTYTNYELGFSFQYPPDLVLNTSNPAAVVVTFPGSYFSAVGSSAGATFSVTVSSASCASEGSSGSTVSVGGFSFNQSTQELQGGVANGGTTVSTYQENNNNVCYGIAYASQGSDNMNIDGIVSSMLSTFAFINTPVGENEASYSAQQSAGQNAEVSGNGIIDLSSLSTTTVSVGAGLTLTGSGFLGHDTIVWISNGSVNGVLWGGMPSSDTSITAAVPPQACTQYVGASGAACPSYLILSPGTYTVSVSNQNGTTDPVYIRIQ